jgi:hypothetical protein
MQWTSGGGGVNYFFCKKALDSIIQVFDFGIVK